ARLSPAARGLHDEPRAARSRRGSAGEAVRRRIAVQLAFSGLLSLAACHRAEPAETAPPPGETWLTEAQIKGARLVIEPAGTRTLALHLVTAGRVAFDEARVAHDFSSVSGRVTKVVGALGQRVGRGDALAIIESPDLGSAWSDLIKARADLVAADH